MQKEIHESGKNVIAVKYVAKVVGIKASVYNL